MHQAGYTNRMFSRPLRSVLYVPAANDKALGKLPSLSMDAAIVDLEDAVHPDSKAGARETMLGRLAGWTQRNALLAVRINPLDGSHGLDDLKAALEIRPDAIVLPKVEAPATILALSDALSDLDADPAVRIWAMIETPRAVFNLAQIAELGHHHTARLNCFVTGANDLMKETGVRDAAEMQPWLMQIVLAAKAGGLAALDGVHSDFADSSGFEHACRLARNRGFDGKTLIHPSQIAPANRIFAPDANDIAEARVIIDAYALPENASKGVISVSGRMVERLHLAMAEQTLALAMAISEKD
jgi:citrate lyase subunit beta / citryl-CoA lyase